MKTKTTTNIALSMAFICLILQSITSALGAQAIPREIWISTNATAKFYPTDPGTIDSPLDGSTAANFDSNMDSLPPHSTIHILAGRYDTMGYGVTLDGTNWTGGWNPKTGQKIYGSGIDATILEFPADKINAGEFNHGNGGLFIQNSLYITNIEVCDMTLDCNYQSGVNCALGGMVILGYDNAVRRVKVINTAQYSSGPETWGIVLKYTSPEISSGNIIEGCEVSHYRGGPNMYNLSAIGFQGYSSGIIRGNRVYGDGLPSFGIGPGFGPAIIEGNYVEGVSSVIHSDGGSGQKIWNQIWTHNMFVNCGYIFEFHYGGMANISIINNQAILTNNCYNGQMVFFFSDTNAVGYTNFSIIGNTVSISGNAAASTLNCFINAGSVQGLLIANNTVDYRLTNMIPTADMVVPAANCKNVKAFNNYDLVGNPIADLNNVSGDGSKLSNLDPANISYGTANINVTGHAATATTATSFSGSLTGDVTGTQSATVVSSVGGQTAANVAGGASAANAATSANTASTIVKRDSSGNFSAGTLTLTSGLTAGGDISEAAGHSYMYDGVKLGYGITGSEDYFFGNSGNSTMTGLWNTSVGSRSLMANTTGNGNIAIGELTLWVNTVGCFNVGVGRGALQSNVTGSANTGIGDLTLAHSPVGGGNTAIGSQALYSHISGDFNTAIGCSALGGITNGTYNIALGAFAGFNVANANYNIHIGNGGLPGDNNIIRIGTSQTDAYIAGTLHLSTNLVVAGTNSAGYFSGDGGGLTNLSASSLPIYSASLTNNWTCLSNFLFSVQLTNTPMSVTLPIGTYQFQVTVTAANVALIGTGGGIVVGYVMTGGPSCINEIETFGEGNNLMSGNFSTSTTWPPYLSSEVRAIGTTTATYGQFIYMGQLIVTNTTTYTICAASHNATTNPFVIYQGSGMTFTKIK